MSAGRLQHIARALLARGVSGEVVSTDAGGFTVVVDDVDQVEAARGAVAGCPEVTRVTAHG
jgi:hypothetical protein